MSRLKLHNQGNNLSNLTYLKRLLGERKKITVQQQCGSERHPGDPRAREKIKITNFQIPSQTPAIWNRPNWRHLNLKRIRIGSRGGILCPSSKLCRGLCRWKTGSRKLLTRLSEWSLTSSRDRKRPSFHMKTSFPPVRIWWPGEMSLSRITTTLNRPSLVDWINNRTSFMETRLCQMTIEKSKW